MGHNIIVADITITNKGHNNKNSGLLWGAIITIWGLHWQNNNNKGAILTITMRGYTSIIGT